MVPIAPAFADDSLFELDKKIRAFEDRQKRPSSPLDSFKGRVLIGREIEIPADRLSTILHLFDLKSIDKKQLFKGSERRLEEKGIFRDYLLAPGNFESLPQALQARLLDGRKLAQSKLITGQVQIPEAMKKLMEKKPSSEQGLILPGQNPSQQAIVAPSGLTAQALPNANQGAQVLSPLGTPRVSSLPEVSVIELNHAWNQLPFETRFNAVELERLNRRALGFYIESELHLLKKGSDPEGILSNLKWKNDGLRIIEFVDAKPMDDPAELARQTRKFARVTGIESRLFNRTGALMGDSSLHIHISVPEFQGDFRPLAEAFRQLIDLRVIARGDLSPLGGQTYGQSAAPIATKASSVRLVGRDRIEFRVIGDSLEETFPFFLENMLEPDQAKAIERVQAASRALISPEVANRVLRGRREAGSVLFRGTLYEKLIEQLDPTNTAASLDQVKRILKTIGPEAENWLRDPQSGLSKALLQSKRLFLELSDAQKESIRHLIFAPRLTTVEVELLSSPHVLKWVAQRSELVTEVFKKSSRSADRFDLLTALLPAIDPDHLPRKEVLELYRMAVAANASSNPTLTAILYALSWLPQEDAAYIPILEQILRNADSNDSDMAADLMFRNSQFKSTDILKWLETVADPAQMDQKSARTLLMSWVNFHVNHPTIEPKVAEAFHAYFSKHGRIPEELIAILDRAYANESAAAFALIAKLTEDGGASELIQSWARSNAAKIPARGERRLARLREVLAQWKESPSERLREMANASLALIDPPFGSGVLGSCVRDRLSER